MSFFASDKDLRKAPPRQNNRGSTARVSSKATTNNHSSKTIPEIRQSSTLSADFIESKDVKSSESLSIVQKAKIEREIRQHKREQVSQAVVLQRWCRGIVCRAKLNANFISDLTKKLADIERLNSLMNQSSPGTKFAIPVTMSLPLLKELIYVTRYANGELYYQPKNRKRPDSKSAIEANRRNCMITSELRRKFTDFVLISTINQTDKSKNIIVSSQDSDLSFRQLCFLVASLLKDYCSQLQMALGSRTLVQASLSERMGGGENKLYTTIVSLLTQLLPNTPKEQFLAVESAKKSLVDRLINHYSLMQTIRDILSSQTGKFIKLGSDTMDNNGSALEVIASLKGRNSYSMDELFDVSFRLLVESSPKGSEQSGKFIELFLAVPLVTLIFSDQCIQLFLDGNTAFAQRLVSDLSQHKRISCLLEFLNSQNRTLELSNGHVVLANICSFVGLVVRIESYEGKLLLESLLRLCAEWLLLFPIPGALQGNAGVLLRKDGTSLTAVGLPYALSLQVLSVLDPFVSKLLFEKVFPSYRAVSDWSCVGPAKDAEEVRAALSDVSLSIVGNSFQEQQKEASSWFSSSWAKRLGFKGVSLSTPDSVSVAAAAASQVASNSADVNSSSGKSFSFFGLFGAKSSASSSNLQVKPSPSPATATATATVSCDRSLLSSLCSLWGLLLPLASNSRHDSLLWRSLSYLTFSLPVVDAFALLLLEKDMGLAKLLKQFQPDKHMAAVAIPVTSPSPSLLSGAAVGDDVQPYQSLFVMITTMKLLLIALDDSELYDQNKPFPLYIMLGVIRCLNGMLFKMISSDPAIFDDLPSSAHHSSAHGNPLAENLIAMRRQSIARSFQFTLSNLYARWARRPFSQTGLWSLGELYPFSFQQEMTQRTPFAVTLLRIMPWSIDFFDRMKFIRSDLDSERVQIQGSNDLSVFASGFRSPGTIIRIRRSRVLEDGMDSLSRVGSAAWKDRLVIRYINDFGAEEAGIDVGGLFKDFFTELSARIFDPAYGLFSQTPDGQLFPNPSAGLLFDSLEMENTYTFLGRVLAKAVYENITIQPRFAHFFLAFMHGRYNFMNLINDLVTLDRDLFKNLMFLKTWDGDVSDLCLTFTVTDSSMGANQEIELVPGGAGVSVTNQNRHRYISLVAKYYLHDRIRVQSGAFFRGMRDILSVDQLSIFCPPELQILISGSHQGIDMDDLKRYTQYAGGYMQIDIHMTRFWAVLKELTVEDQAALLRFVTACPRPPSLGFSALHPAFTIQRVDCSDDSRLPTASTCFNILKLPTYSSQKILKEKLLMSIHSKSGFDLS